MRSPRNLSSAFVVTAQFGRGDGEKKTVRTASFAPCLSAECRLQFCQINFGVLLKKEIKMCDSCGCTPREEPIEDEVCSGCGKPTAECICEPEEK